MLRQEVGSSPEIFRAVASDLISALRLAGNDRAELVVGERLEAWKVFFEHAGGEGLGLEAQQGLFGELWLLGECLAPVLGPGPAVTGWTGPLRANHDFQFGKRAIEVKTSASKQHQKIHISSERQLSLTGLTSLEIAFVSLAVSEGGGIPLPDQVAKIRALLASDPPRLRVFQEKLIEAGYTDAHAGLYTTGFAVRAFKTFEVSEDFPMIREATVPPGVGDVSFSIVISACEPFRVDPEAMFTRIKSTVEERQSR